MKSPKSESLQPPAGVRRGDRHFNSKQHTAENDRPIASTFEPPSLDTKIFPAWLALFREGVEIGEMVDFGIPFSPFLGTLLSVNRMFCPFILGCRFR